MTDLRAADVKILTLGQYLRPSAQHLPVARFYHPDEFAELAVRGREMGFAHVESGPLVRSSYHAKRQTDALGEVQPKASRADTKEGLTEASPPRER
jgi:lipoic acid synthetase